jgi:electron transfer flavoprotein alpha subunit
MSILVIAEHDNANLKGATLNTVSAAAKLGADIDVLVAGAGLRRLPPRPHPSWPAWPR